MLLSKDRSQHSGAATAPALHTSQLRCFTKTGLFPPLFLHSGCWIMKEKAAKGFLDPAVPSILARSGSFLQRIPLSPTVRELPEQNRGFVCQGANCASPWGSSTSAPLKKRGKKKKHFKKPTLNKTAAGRLLD